MVFMIFLQIRPKPFVCRLLCGQHKGREYPMVCRLFYAEGIMPGLFRTVLFLDPGLIIPRIFPGRFADFSGAGRQGLALPRTDSWDLFSWCR
jgi:hypothetical protein